MRATRRQIKKAAVVDFSLTQQEVTFQNDKRHNLSSPLVALAKIRGAAAARHFEPRRRYCCASNAT
jgi:hypothetical protein